MEDLLEVLRPNGLTTRYYYDDNTKTYYHTKIHQKKVNTARLSSVYLHTFQGLVHKIPNI